MFVLIFFSFFFLHFFCFVFSSCLDLLFIRGEINCVAPSVPYIYLSNDFIRSISYDACEFLSFVAAPLHFSSFVNLLFVFPLNYTSLCFVFVPNERRTIWFSLNELHVFFFILCFIIRFVAYHMQSCVYVRE